MRLKQDAQLLQAALIGYQQRRAEIDAAIAAITASIDGHRGVLPAVAGQPVRKRKPLSAAARKRIAAAQKKRWAAYHRQKGARAA